MSLELPIRIFEGNVEPELLLDASWRIVAVTAGYLRAVNRSRADVVGRFVHEVYPYAGDGPLTAALLGSLAVLRDASLLVPNRLAECPSESDWRWGISRAVTDDAGRIEFVVHTFKPEQQGPPRFESAHEVKLSKVIEHSYDTMALFDRHGRATYVSPSITRLLGYTEAEFADRALTSIHPEDREQFIAQLARLQETPGGMLISRFRSKHCDGTWRYIECASTNLLNDPDIEAVVANFHDVTLHFEFETQLQAINDELVKASLEREELLERERAANVTKDEFLAILGHELRNPLSPIVTALQLIRSRGGGKSKEFVIIERQVRHMVRLVDDLLDVSRITRGKIELRRTKVELADVVAKAIEMTSPLLEKRRQDLRSAVPTGGLLIDGDEIRLAQVVANLLNNAAKYSPVGSFIEISAAAVDGQAVLRVKDQGCGISADLKPRLFEQFTQGERAPGCTTGGGLGLGLAIVRNLVELHGGTVSAESEGLGRGSCFTVVLPIADRAALASTPSAGAPFSGPRTRTRGRVLVVDDNEDAAMLLADLLQTAGYSARTAFDGPTALAVADEFQPELGLLDIGLPVMDGYELGHRLHARTALAGLRLIAVSGYGQAQDRERSLQEGFVEHIVKPVDFERLLDMVAHFLSAEKAEAPSTGISRAG